MTIRQWLAKAITGNRPGWPFSDSQDLNALLADARQEGVCALLHEQIALDGAWAEQMPQYFREAIAAHARDKALQSLLLEHECRRLLAILHQANLPVLLLKGSALAYWVYKMPYTRERSDIDLLFRNKADADAAVKLLADLKFDWQESALPGDLVGFETTCRRTAEHGAPLEVDVHWRLSNVPMFAFRFTFDELMQDAIVLETLAPNALGLAAIPAFLHASMHRVQNISDGAGNHLKWLFDLEELGKNFTKNDWRRLGDIAIEKKLAGVCLSGIHAAAEYFGEQAPVALIERLKMAEKNESMDVRRMHRWFYIQRMNFMAYPSMVQRLRWLRQRLFPGASYMRAYYGKERGFAGLLIARLRGLLGRLKP